MNEESKNYNFLQSVVYSIHVYVYTQNIYII